MSGNHILGYNDETFWGNSRPPIMLIHALYCQNDSYAIQLKTQNSNLKTNHPSPHVPHPKHHKLIAIHFSIYHLGAGFLQDLFFQKGGESPPPPPEKSVTPFKSFYISFQNFRFLFKMLSFALMVKSSMNVWVLGVGGGGCWGGGGADLFT